MKMKLFAFAQLGKSKNAVHDAACTKEETKRETPLRLPVSGIVGIAHRILFLCPQHIFSLLISVDICFNKL